MAGALASARCPGLILKIVCFDEIDLAWAKRVRERAGPDVPLFLSAGTPVPSPGRSAMRSATAIDGCASGSPPTWNWRTRVCCRSCT